jgi:hypothetical protein
VVGVEWRERGESWRRGVGQGAEERLPVAAAGRWRAGRRAARVSRAERRERGVGRLGGELGFGVLGRSAGGAYICPPPNGQWAGPTASRRDGEGGW